MEHEMDVCECAADRYPNNYNAWSHRSWVIQQFAAGDMKVRCSDGSLRFLMPHTNCVLTTENNTWSLVAQW